MEISEHQDTKSLYSKLIASNYLNANPNNKLMLETILYGTLQQVCCDMKT